MPRSFHIPSEGIYSIQFWKLGISGYLFFASFNMIIPELPDFLTSLGGGEYKGLIISLFTLTAMISRPFSGKLADRWGRIPVMVFGAVVSGIAGLLYPFVVTVGAFLWLRFFHGFSTGFKPTGTAAYVADIVVPTRRGEAMGVVSFFSIFGMASGPPLGSWVASQWSLDVMFYCSSLFALASVLILLGMKETATDNHDFRLSELSLKWADFYEPRVLLPSVVLFFSVFAFGAVLTVTPDFSKYLEIENKGLFFTFFTVSSMMVRFFAGKASDLYGRRIVMTISTVLLTISMFIVGFAQEPWMFFLGAFIFGLGTGSNSPTVFAWTIDLADDAHRGRAVATMYIALELGIGFGALTSGILFANDYSRFPLVFGAAGLMSAIAFTILRLTGKRPGN